MTEYEHEPKQGTTHVTIPGEVAFNPELSPTDMFVWWMINSLDKSENHCWATNGYIGKHLGFTPNTISISIRKLKALGYVDLVFMDHTKRILAINLDYIKIHRHHIERYNKKETSVTKLKTRKKRIPEKERVIKDDMGDVIKKYNESHLSKQTYKDNKINNIDNTSLLYSKEREVNDSDESLPCSDKNSLIKESFKRKRELATNPETQELFDFWNEMSNLTTHVMYKKTQEKAFIDLDKALTEHSSKDIRYAITTYNDLIGKGERISIHTEAAGHKVGLDQFFGFSSFTKSKISKQTKWKLPIKKSWFEECRKGMHPEDKFRNVEHVEDPNPVLTAKIKKVYAKKVLGNGKIKPEDENEFRKASKEFIKYLKDTRNLSFVYGEVKSKPETLVHYIFDALESKHGDLDKPSLGISPRWLSKDWTYTDTLQKYFSNQGYISDTVIPGYNPGYNPNRLDGGAF